MGKAVVFLLFCCCHGIYKYATRFVLFSMQLDNARLHFVIETKSEKDFVGYLTLRDENPKNRDGDIAITLTQKYWGKGYGAEVLRFTVDIAFRALNLHRVSLGTFSVNERAIKLYKKV